MHGVPTAGYPNESQASYKTREMFFGNRPIRAVQTLTQEATRSFQAKIATPILSATAQGSRSLIR